jgi:MATE family multidrug resistance protein
VEPPATPSPKATTGVGANTPGWRGAWDELRATLTLALPIMAGLVGQMLMGLTDTLMVGQLGTLPLAAAAFGSSLIHLPFVAAIGLVSAVAVMTSHAYGGHDRAAAGEALRHGVGLAALAGAVSALFLLAVRDRSAWLGQPADVVAEARAYIGWVGWSLVPALVTLVVKQFSEALNRPWPPTLIMLGGVLLNVLLNWLWIFGHAGFPALGLEGAGLATLAARAATLAGLACFVAWNRGLAEWLPRRWLGAVTWRVARRQLELGLPVGLQHLLEVGAFVLGAFMMGWLSAEALAAHQIAITCAATTFIFALGFGMAVSIRVGHAWGAQDHARWQRTGWVGLGFAVVLMSGFGVLFLLANGPIARAFVPELEVVTLAAQLLVVAGLFQVFDGLQVVALSALRGLGDVRRPAWLVALAYWVVALPLAAVLGFAAGWGAVGVWIGLAIGLATAAATLIARFRSRVRAAAEG